jgi:hypothetical protein
MTTVYNPLYIGLGVGAIIAGYSFAPTRKATTAITILIVLGLVLSRWPIARAQWDSIVKGG